ncbi:MAG: hypothetical protein ACYDCO_27440 [Armatimonadota bacterium]
MTIRYIGHACLIFGAISAIIGHVGPETYWIGLFLTGYGSVIFLVGLILSIAPPVSGLRFASIFLFTMAGINLIFWSIGIFISNDTMFHASLVISLVLIFHGWLARVFRVRFGDRVPETTPVDLRREISDVFWKLPKGNPAKSPVFIRFTTPTFEFWHGWLSPQGYMVFLSFKSPVAFNENLVTAALHISRVCAVERADFIITPTGEVRGEWVKAHISVETDLFANAIITRKSLENFRSWGDRRVSGE